MRKFLALSPILFIVAALVVALIAEYVFDFKPCTYCVYQRYIFAAAGIFFLTPRSFWLAIFMLIAGLALSLYQIGLEQHLWEDIIKGCLANTPSFNTVEEMRQALSQTPLTHCDDNPWKIFGLSATVWTGAFQGFLIIYALLKRKIYKDG